MRNGTSASRDTAGILVALILLLAGCQTPDIRATDQPGMVLVPKGKLQWVPHYPPFRRHPDMAFMEVETIHVPAFYIDAYEVTTARYATFLHATGRRPPDGWDQVDLRRHGDFPVVEVDWQDAADYCASLGKRLPTSHEWVRAALGNHSGYLWLVGAPPGAANVGQRYTTQGVYEDRLAPVGSHPRDRSPYGVFDVGGNVSEWTQEQQVRGRSWFRGSSENMEVSPDTRSAEIGFRCAMDQP